jgi:hypothetical protein
MAKKQETGPEAGWVIKDRNYILKGNLEPITFTLASRHHTRTPLLYFDEEKGYARELRYATNQKSPLVDEQEGRSTLGHIVFKNGVLSVSRANQGLQKLLSIYHPGKDVVYEELDPVAEAKDELFDIELELEALNLAKGLEIDHAEAVLRVEAGSVVGNMTSSEIKRDLMIFAKQSPETFIALVNDDNVQLRNFGIKATEASIIRLAQDQRSFVWGSNGRKLMTIPFEENPYSALAAWFKTDEGTEVYKAIEKKLK